MLKPEKAWAVGDKMFATYDEARTYIASRRGELHREALIVAVQTAIAVGYGIAKETDAENVADAILAKFKIIPRKP